MATTLADNSNETARKSRLNKGANPSQPLIEGMQLTLGSAEEKCREGAVALALLAKQAQRENGFSLSTLGGLVGKDAVAAHRTFNEDEPSTALMLVAALLILDTERVWMRGASRLIGCDLEERPALSDAEFRRRVEARAKASKAAAALLEEALEDVS